VHGMNSASTPDAAVAIRGLGFHYDTPSGRLAVLDDVSFDVDAGTTRLDRDEIARYRREVVGFVFQDFGLLGQLTALENVELALTFARVPHRRRRARARTLLTAAGLGDRLNHRPRALSGGEKQRVAIARALANDPLLVLADEPTGNLDARSTATVLKLLMRVPAEHGSTVIVVTHDDTVAGSADRRLHLVHGRIESG
jgi:putative ABC transport system ATP-binding protein